jgi:hypothetical protein
MGLSVADTNGVSTEEAIRMLDEFWGNRTLDWLSKITKATVIHYKLLQKERFVTLYFQIIKINPILTYSFYS